MKIVVGYDESRAAQEALRVAVDQAKIFGAKIELVHSLIERTDTDYDVISRAKEALEKARKEVVEKGVDCEAYLLNNDLTPGEDLVQFAIDHQVDQIVIGVKKLSRVSKLVFGSNARHVILHAHCPVLSVK